MKTFLAITFGAILLTTSALSIYYHPLQKTNEDAFAENFLSSLEETIPTLKWPATLPTHKTNAVKIPILVYHSVRPPFTKQTKLMRTYNVPPETFEKQLQYLKDNHYNIISLKELQNYSSKNAPLTLNPIIITFDDGWKNQYKYAFPILKKFGFTATFFIYTNAVNKKHFLTWSQIKEMASAGMTIGAHTKSHPYLLNISANTTKLRDEIIGSKKILEKQLGTPIEFFAYPFGHYNDAILKIVKEAGFTMARSTYADVYQNLSSPLTLHGNEVQDNLNQFVQMLTQTTFAKSK